MFQFYCCKRDYIFHNLIKKNTTPNPQPPYPQNKKIKKKAKNATNKWLNFYIKRIHVMTTSFSLMPNVTISKIIIEVYIDKITVFELTS